MKPVFCKDGTVTVNGVAVGRWTHTPKGWCSPKALWTFRNGLGIVGHGTVRRELDWHAQRAYQRLLEKEKAREAR